MGPKLPVALGVLRTASCLTRRPTHASFSSRLALLPNSIGISRTDSCDPSSRSPERDSAIGKATKDCGIRGRAAHDAKGQGCRRHAVARINVTGCEAEIDRDRIEFKIIYNLIRIKRTLRIYLQVLERVESCIPIAYLQGVQLEGESVPDARLPSAHKS